MGEGERRPYVEAEAYGTTGLSDALVMQRQERRINELEGELKRLRGKVRALTEDLTELQERVRETGWSG